MISLATPYTGMEVEGDHDFMVALLRRSKRNIVIWVTVDQDTKLAHFISFHVGQSMEVLADQYIWKVVRMHGVVEIVSNRDTRFMSHYCTRL